LNNHSVHATNGSHDKQSAAVMCHPNNSGVSDAYGFIDINAVTTAARRQSE